MTSTTHFADTLDIEALLAQHSKIAIAGVPRSGKTTLAKVAWQADPARYHLCTDDFIEQPWSEVPEMIIEELAEMGNYVVEGVMVGRALRKGLRPDLVIYLGTPRVELSKGQETMAKGIRTIFADWLSSSSFADEAVVIGWEEE